MRRRADRRARTSDQQARETAVASLRPPPSGPLKSPTEEPSGTAESDVRRDDCRVRPGARSVRRSIFPCPNRLSTVRPVPALDSHTAHRSPACASHTPAVIQRDRARDACAVLAKTRAFPAVRGAFDVCPPYEVVSRYG